jgi:alkylhydroperoxidase family enzyme
MRTFFPHALGVAAALAVFGPSRSSADAPSAADTPPPVPVTRTELKQTLENSKHSKPRLPLPPLTAEEKAKAAEGDWGVVNNGRMRKHYLPAEVTGGGFLRGTDPVMSLGYPFQTMLFWIVSRGNNCTYCLGHQESKLAAAGVGEDRVAALDGDWSEFTPAERSAFALAKKLTYEPHKLTADDIERLRPFYNDAQILEAVLVVGNFNAMNRWTGALRIPQEEHRAYLTATADRYKDLRSRVAPLSGDASGTPACAAPAQRPPLESRAEVESALSACRSRAPRLPLVADDKARAAIPSGWELGSAPVPQWVRLVATFPKAGPARVAMHRATETKGRLNAKLKAEIAWVAARNDRAWYALNDARRRLHAVGLTDDQIFALDSNPDALAPAERLALAFARKLTVDPALITDTDVEGLRKHYGDFEVAEIVHQVTEAAFFDRVTEAAGLKAED